MISYPIKTWGCKCGYRQDFEPTEEAMNEHFNSDRSFPVGNLKKDECPACALTGKKKKLARVLDSSKKMYIRHLEQADIDALVERAEGETERKEVGEELRLETDEEKSERLDQEVAQAKGMTAAQKKKFRAELNGQQNIVRIFKVFREETTTEKEVRVSRLRSLKPATEEEISASKTLYEDTDL